MTTSDYLKQIKSTLAQGNATTNEPKRVACGAPDFIVTRSRTPLGYVETKDVGKNLDEVEKSEQLTWSRQARLRAAMLKRYTEGLAMLKALANGEEARSFIGRIT